ncbi:MAG: methyltransferase domain-containing protein [Flavobacteriales bacterium]
MLSKRKQKLGKHEHATFMVSDMEGLDLGQHFDIVLLPDVLEHIPEEKHQDLFRTIERHLAPDGVVCIHIPDPDSIQWMQEHRPDRLQIVDQPLAISSMVERFKACDLLLERYERYGLWTVEADYDWMEFPSTAASSCPNTASIPSTCP